MINENLPEQRETIIMGYEISDESRVKTTKCQWDFRCLANGAADICEVQVCLGENSLLLRNRPTQFCTYHLELGTSGKTHICSCPVRIELYKRHGV